MTFGGIQKLSALDFPDHLAVTVFTVGCDFRCPYCQNPELVRGEYPVEVPEEEVLELLEERKGFVDGLCVTGGEPLLHRDIVPFLRRVKEVGMDIKVDTNGHHPDLLRELLDDGLVDYVAVDIKAPPSRYRDVVRAKVDVSKIEESISLLKETKVPHEFRTTVVPGLLEDGEYEEIARWLKGAPRYALQAFRPVRTLDPEFRKLDPTPPELLKDLCRRLSPYFLECEVRG